MNHNQLIPLVKVCLDSRHDVLRLICAYAQQGGISLEKQSFYDELRDLVMCLGDFNGHVGGHIYGFHEDHGRYGIRQKKFE